MQHSSMLLGPELHYYFFPFFMEHYKLELVDMHLQFVPKMYV